MLRSSIGPCCGPNAVSRIPPDPRLPLCDDGPVRLSSIDRRIITLAVTALGTLAIEPLYLLVDTAIVGRLGTDPLAGLAIASTILLTVSALFIFLQYGTTPDVARAEGAGDTASSKLIATDTTWLAIMLGIPVGAAIALLARPLAITLGGTGDVLVAATTYLRISAIGLPFIFVAMVGHGIMRGHNDLRKPLIVVLIANVANVILELIVVYGFDMGVAGSAWSTVIVQIGAAIMFGFILRPHLANVKPSWQRMRPILARGTHFGLRSIAMLAAWIAMIRVAASVDTPTLAATQVLIQLFTLMALALDALAIPAQSLVAGALGASDREGAMAIGWSSRRLSLWVGAAFCLLLLATYPVLPDVFTNDPEVASRVAVGILFLAVMQFPGAIAFALDGVLIGGHDAKFLSRAAVLNLLSAAPLLIATALHPSLGIAGLWGAELALMVSRAGVNSRRFGSRRWMAHEPVSVGAPTP